MKYLILFLMTVSPLFSETLYELVLLAKENNIQVKAVKEQAKSAKARSDAAFSSWLPEIDASFGGTYLAQQPEMYLHVDQMNYNKATPTIPDQYQPIVEPLLDFADGLVVSSPTASMRQYTGTVALKYPVFTGFARFANVDKAELTHHKAKLKVQDTVRNTYLSIVQNYAKAVAYKEYIVAEEKALHQIVESYKKTQGFHNEGLIAPSELYRIEASKHSTEAFLEQVKNVYKSTLKQISLLVNKEISDVSTLPSHRDNVAVGELVKKAYECRPDLKSLFTLYKMSEEDVTLASSDFYPDVDAVVAWSQYGDTPSLAGDGYSNAVRSYAGFQVSWKFYTGLQTFFEREAAQTAKMSTFYNIQYYKEQIRTELEKTFLTFESNKNQVIAANKAVIAQEKYYESIAGQFENHLVNAEIFSLAVSNLAQAQYKLASAKAMLYATYASLLLQVDNEEFLDTF